MLFKTAAAPTRNVLVLLLFMDAYNTLNNIARPEPYVTV